MQQRIGCCDVKHFKIGDKLRIRDDKFKCMEIDGSGLLVRRWRWYDTAYDWLCSAVEWAEEKLRGGLAAIDEWFRKQGA